MNREQRELSEMLKETPKSGQAIAQAIALVICTAQQAIERVGLTESDLAQFFDAASQSDVLMPLLDPTAWMRGGRETIDEGKARGEVIRQLLALPTRGPSLLDSELLTAGFSRGVCNGYLVAPLVEDQDEDEDA